MENEKIKAALVKLKKNADKKYHCLLYQMTWDFTDNLSDEYWSAINTVLETCAKKNKRPLHKYSVSTNRISLIVQGHPDISAEEMYRAFHVSLEAFLLQNISEINNKEFWTAKTSIFTIDQSDLE